MNIQSEVHPLPDQSPQILQVMLQFLPHWEGTNLSDIKLERMAGITNKIYKVTRKGEEQAYIYREFGDASDNIFLDRKTEEFVYQVISDCGTGPHIYGMTGFVRVEEFIQSTVLKMKDMLTEPIIVKLAFALRRFHEIEPKFDKESGKKSLFSQIFFKEDPEILHKCHRKMSKPIFTQSQTYIIQQLKPWISLQQIKFLQQASIPLEQTPLIFSHNDLLAGNVLIRNKDKKINFIDYEYSCYNYEVYDLANYLNQCMYNYEVQEPPYFQLVAPAPTDQQMQRKLLECYTIASDHLEYQTYLQAVGQLTQAQREKVENMQQQMLVARMLSHMMWGCWAVIVSKNESISFDYIRFAEIRRQGYLQAKAEYLQIQKQKVQVTPISIQVVHTEGTIV